MLSHYVRLNKAKHLLDSDIDSITDTREDSYVIQPNIQGGFSTKSEPHTPQNKTVGVDVRDSTELFPNFSNIDYTTYPFKNRVGEIRLANFALIDGELVKIL